ncbi:SCO2400 family protein [Streptomyces lonegramiae]|uniref:Zinc-ribbon domain-containing protein n=1 Tax=Streptomyces lonegramiae TaxID=3075524 RepID=A0ABU2X8V8_9ACTN|nr:hypothetical protein [Streptomyces sp. DSM 41529]
MDYCPSCHRHLNGAVSCPGCGAYAVAEEYAYPAAEAAAVEAAAVDYGRDGDEGAEVEPAPEPVAASTRADRRKAARRKPKPRGIVGGRARRARRGRGRRVTIMASVLGPILAALFVAEIATEGGIFHEPSTTSSPDKSEAERGPGEGDSSGPRVRESGAPGAGPAGASAGVDGPSADESRSEDGASDEDKDKGKKKARDSSSPSADDPSSTDGPDDPSATAPTTGSGGGGGGGGATQSPTTPSDPGTTTSVPTQPTPSPSDTCDRFLWWCT